jgi:gamma-aminobutyric acid receptor subunit beta
VSVGVSIYILSVHSFSENDMDFTMDFYFRQYWNDPRLAFRKLPDLEYFTGDIDFGRSIWMPDSFFVNERESFLHTMTKKNEFVKVYHTGEVVRSIRCVSISLLKFN